jgi:protocatechuate 3,4-dioxygenase beta subunit
MKPRPLRAGSRLVVRSLFLLALALAVTMCTDNTGPSTWDSRPSTAPKLTVITPTGLATVNPPQVFAGAGDIATCNSNNDEATAALVDNIAGTVFVIGDNVYQNGSATEYTNCYQPTWGRHKARTKPVPGNHDYNTSGGTGYFNYFGAAAGTAGQGYYSYDLGAWHIVALNSEISKSPSSPQMQWLRADLAAHPNLCTLAYWHEPLYSSIGGSGSGGAVYSAVRPYWDTLYAYGADLVLNGHRHDYERIAPIKPDGTPSSAFGIRTIVAGMGGIGHGNQDNVFPASEARNGSTYGVLKLYLYDDSYAWKFVPVVGQTFTDSGSTACHSAPGGGGGGGGVSSSRSTVTAAPGNIAASNGASTSTITVTAKDANGNPVSGATVVLAASGAGNTLTQPSGPTNASGVATGTLSSTGSGSKTVSATISGVAITQTATVTVTAGPPNAAQSTVAAAPSTIAVGTGSSTLTVTVKDGFGNPVSGATVVLAASGSGNTLAQPTGPTNGSGVATGTLSSTTVESKTISATANGTPITQTAVVTVTAAPPPGISHTLLTSGNNLTNQNVYTTAAIAPAPNTLVTIAVMSHRSSAPISPTVSGGGMASWTLVASVDFDTLSVPHRRLSIYRGMSASPGSGPITFNYSSQVSNVEWIVSQWTGVETSGINGAGAIGQSGSNQADAGTGLSVALSPFGSAANVAYGVFGVSSQVLAVNPGSGFTEIDEQPANESAKGDLQAEWAVNRNTIDATWTNLRGGALGLEIKATTGP